MIFLPGGTNVFPEEIEAVYADSPFIRDVAVLEREGALVALVVPNIEAIRDRGTGRIEDLLRETMSNLSLRLPSHQRVSGYAIGRDALPRTHLGKFRRHLLPALYARAREGAGPTPGRALSDADRALLGSATGERLWDWLAARYPDKPLNPDTSPQLDLGVDSLGWVNLTLEIEEHLGITLTEEAIARVVTIRDLLIEAAAAELTPPVGPTARRPAYLQETLPPDLARWLAPTGPFLTVLRWLIYYGSWIMLRGVFRLRVEGVERIPQAGPFVLAANHTSYLDPFAVAASLPSREMRRTYWAGGTAPLFTSPTRRLFSRAAHVFPVDPDRTPRSSLAFGSAVLERGNALIWFPEGRRSPSGRLQRFMPGIGVLLERFGVPVVPVHISGTFEALPKGRRFPRLVPLKVVFGHPLDSSKLDSLGAGENAHTRIADALHHAVAALAVPDRTDEPPRNADAQPSHRPWS